MAEQTHPSWTWSQVVAHGLLAAIFCGLVIYGSPGTRGYDQFWYVADVQTLVEGGERVNNYIFPALLGEGTGRPAATPFIHDTLNLYLVWPFAELMGSYAAWILCNVLATIATALLVGSMVRRLTHDLHLATVAYGLYLLLPLSLWQACQPLIESTTAPFVMLTVWVYLFAVERPLKYVWMILTLGAAYLCRSSFLPALFVLPLTYWVHTNGSRARKTWIMASLFALAVAVVVFGKFVFVQAMPTSIVSVLTNGLPGGTNMDFLLRIESPSLSFLPVFRKVSGNILDQLAWSDRKLQVFYLPFNLLALTVFSAVASKGKPRTRRLGMAALLGLALHFVTVAVHQNQFRYLLLLLPVVLACGGLWLDQSRWKGKVARGIGLAVLALSLLVSVVLSKTLRQQSLADTKTFHEVSQWANANLEEDEVVAMCDGYSDRRYLFVGALAPRRVMLIRENYDPARYEELFRRTGATRLICPKETVLREFVAMTPLSEPAPLPDRYQNFTMTALHESAR